MKKDFHRVKQPTPTELTDSCLQILRSRFYNQPGDDKCFAQDRSRLLAWVVLWPATWLNKKGVTLHGDQYRKIFHNVLMQASEHVTSKVKYRPAYLRQVIQSHFAIHGEDYYDQAKAVRNIAEQAMVVLGSFKPAPDPVKQMALAAQLLKGAGRPSKKVVKPALKEQPNLL